MDARQPSTEASTQRDRVISRTDRPAEALSPAPHPDSRVVSDERYFTHLITVLSVSSAMVGVCLTAIGLIGIVKSLTKLEVIADDLLAGGALIFMATTMLSFFGLRTRLSKVWRGFAAALDFMFCIGLLVVVVATVLLTWFVI